MGTTDASMADHLFLDIPSNVGLEITEMQVQFATGCVIPLLSMPAVNDYLVNKG
jgi:hypothetical protein